MNPKDEERFATAIAVILKHEGGFSNDPRDPGGITNWGITLPFLQEYYDKIDIDKKARPEDIRSMERNEAIQIYKVLLWDQFQYNQIHALPIAIKVFDMAVNMGYSRAHKILQAAINALIKGPSYVAVDGKLGPKTRAAANMLPAYNLLESLRHEQREFYYRLVEQHPKMKWALDGWLLRTKY
jgi:lysozyme family protein